MFDLRSEKSWKSGGDGRAADDRVNERALQGKAPPPSAAGEAPEAVDASRLTMW